MRNRQRPPLGERQQGARRQRELTLADILPSFPRALRQPDGSYRVNCPCHDDRNPSLHLTERDGTLLWHCFAGCSQEEVGDALRRLAGIDRPNHRESRPQGLTLAEYARAKQLDESRLREWGCLDTTYQGRPAIAMEYRDTAGNLVAVRYRLALQGSRFRWRNGDLPSLYGLWRLPEWDTRYLILTEGESDTQTLWQANYPALGIPGAGVWQPEWWSLLEPFEKLYLLMDGDTAGEQLLQRLAQTCPEPLRERVSIVRLPDGVKDVSELWHRAGADPERFRATLQQCERMDLDSWTLGHLNRVSNCPTSPLAPIDLADTLPTPREWLVCELIPAHQITNLYGDSGTCKSYLALYLSLCVLTGQPFLGFEVQKRGRVLYLDFELDADEHTRRWWALSAGAGFSKPPHGLHYLRLHTTLFEAIPQLEPIIAELDPALLIVDSLGFAVGKPLDPDLAIELYRFLDGLNRSVVVIDHTPKLPPDLPSELAREYGTAYKRHYARSALQVDLQGSEANRVGLIVRHQKTNFGQKASELHLAFEFLTEEEQLVAVRVWEGADAVANTEIFGTRGEVLAHLREVGQATSRGVAEALGLSERTARRHLERLCHEGLVVVDEGSYPKVYRPAPTWTVGHSINSDQVSNCPSSPSSNGSDSPTGGRCRVCGGTLPNRELDLCYYCRRRHEEPAPDRHRDDSEPDPPVDFEQRTPIEIPEDDPLEAFLAQATADPLGLTSEEADTVRQLWCFAEALRFPRVAVEGVPAPFVIEQGQQAWLKAIERIAGTVNCQRALQAVADTCRSRQAHHQTEFASGSPPA